jgi:hypothetical protein
MPVTPYQVVVLSAGNFSRPEAIRSTVTQEFKTLGLPEEALVFLDETTVSKRNRKAPAVAVFFGLANCSSETERAIATLLDDSITVIPVVADLNHFVDFVPSILRSLNGMELKDEDPKLYRLAAVILENLSLLRKNRRLFISYRRIESQRAAIQLYELLDAQGFDVFLDSHSIRPGEPFQEILWHRLADTDVVVLLDSPGFMESRWTVEELAKANSTNIQSLQMIWPDGTLQAPSAFSTAFPLSSADFVDSNILGPEAYLVDECLKKLGIAVESLRARALAARHSYLVEEFCADARTAGILPQLQVHKFITFETKSGKRIVTVPTVGIPDAARYQEIEDEIGVRAMADVEVILLYDERGIRDKWLKHIDWLDRQRLRVKSLQVSRAREWFGAQI